MSPNWPRVHPAVPAFRLALIVAAAVSTPAAVEPRSVLFVGDRCASGRVDPVMRHDAGQVNDLTRPVASTSFANPAGWDLLGNLALLNFYATQIENCIHDGIQPGPDSGRATGNPNAWSQAAVNTTRALRGNPNENPAAQVFLYQTWARPDMIYGPPRTLTDPRTGAITPDPAGGTKPVFQASLEAMTADLHNADYGLAATNPDFAGVAPVGDAFLRAVQSSLATRDPYAPEAQGDGLLPLWWDDGLHASRYGSDLSALVIFGTLTGVDPWSFGANERAAADIGISPRDASRLQQVASGQLAASGLAVVRVPCLRANPRAVRATKDRR